MLLYDFVLQIAVLVYIILEIYAGHLESVVVLDSYYSLNFKLLVFNVGSDLAIHVLCGRFSLV